MSKQFINPTGAGYYAQIKAIAEGGYEDDQENFFAKGLTSQTGGSGAEFIPEGYSAKIIWQLYEDNWARQLFGTWVVTQGVKENIPKFSTKLVEASGVSSGIDAIPSELTSTTSIKKATMTTTEVEIELKTFSTRLEIQNKFLAYNVSSQIEGELRSEIASAMVEMEENVIVNGDTESSSASNINYTYNSSSNKHGVNTATGDNEELLLFDGIRVSATGTAVDNASAAFDESDFRQAMKNLGVFARKGKEKMAFIVSPDLHYSMMGFTQLQTLDKYGPSATIVTGEVGKIYGIRVIETDKMPCTERGTLTNNAGIRAASANSFTEGALIYVNTVILGVPNKASRTFNIKKKDWPEYDRQDLIAIEDFGVAFKYPEAIVRMYDGT